MGTPFGSSSDVDRASRELSVHLQVLSLARGRVQPLHRVNRLVSRLTSHHLGLPWPLVSMPGFYCLQGTSLAGASSRALTMQAAKGTHGLLTQWLTRQASDSNNATLTLLSSKYIDSGEEELNKEI